MQITVKSVKVAKTGTNKSGEWELIVVTSEDNTDYTTFDKKAKNLTGGAVIDIGEPTIKEGKIGFKDFTVVSSPASPLPSQNGKPGMSPEAWAEKDRLERHSIEAQTAFKGIVELVKTYIELKAVPDKRLQDVYDKSLNWAEAHFTLRTPSAPKPSEKPVPKKGKSEDTEERGPEQPSDSKTEDLLQWIADKMKWKTTKTARSWLVNACKIPEDKIDSDPSWVYSEVKSLQGWTD